MPSTENRLLVEKPSLIKNALSEKFAAQFYRLISLRVNPALSSVGCFLNLETKHHLEQSTEQPGEAIEKNHIWASQSGSHNHRNSLLGLDVRHGRAVRHRIRNFPRNPLIPRNLKSSD